MQVLKFGGTSVGSPERMQQLPELIAAQKDDSKIVVLSALSGVTNCLEAVATAVKTKNKVDFEEKLKWLTTRYDEFIKTLLQTTETQVKAETLVQQQLQQLEAINASPFSTVNEHCIMAQGELASTQLFQLYLKEQGVQAVLLPALEFMKLNADGEPDYETIRHNLSQLLKENEAVDLYITQGYICSNHRGEVANLQRGGSDYTASIIGAVLQASEIQIWTDIDGFHNNDPRFVNQTHCVNRLSFDEAAELAYFGAKILHPQSVHPARRYNIPVRLLCTMQPEEPGTLITSKSHCQGKIVAIAGKDGITAIRIQSSRMFLAHGFLRRVFEVFERYEVPIDMITTSEVAVSLTIDQCRHLDEIVNDLKQFGAVEVDHNQSIVCVVGDFSARIHGHASMVADAVKHIPVRMISYGGSEHNISLLLPQAHKTEALRALHARLF